MKIRVLRACVPLVLSIAVSGIAAAQAPPSKEPQAPPASGGAPPSPKAGAAGPGDGAPRPPSTGKEAPQAQQAQRPGLPPELATKLVEGALAEWRRPRPDCGKIIRPLALGLPIIAPEVTPQSHEAYLALGRCAQGERFWDLSRRVALILLEAGPRYARPAMLPRAEIGMGRYKDAAESLVRLLKDYPSDPELVATMALAQCKLATLPGEERKPAAWGRCLEFADRALELVKAAPSGPIAWQAHALRVEALFHQDKLDAAGAEIDVLEKLDPGEPRLRKLRRRNAIVKESRLVVEKLVQDTIPLGIYHMYGAGPGALAGALVTLNLVNFAAEDRNVRIEVEVRGVSERTSRTVMLLRGQPETVSLTPSLRTDFNLATVREERPAELGIRITWASPAGERVLYEDTVPVKVLPRDSLPLARKVGEDVMQPSSEFVAAWITPNARAIDGFLAAAKKRAPRQTFSGEQQDTISQVKAIWDELQARGVSYVMDPQVFSGISHVQRTRLPVEVLESTNAQCLEGTLLMATLLEAIGLRPVVVKIPGHAFLGWHATEKDGVKAGELFFIETTAVHELPFERAVRFAGVEVKEQLALGSFRKGTASLIDVKELRQRGIKPQPTE